MESKFNSLTYNNSVTLNWHILLSYLEIKLFPSALAETQGLPGNEIIFEAQVFMKQMPFWKKVGNLHQNFYYAYAVSRTHQETFINSYYYWFLREAEAHLCKKECKTQNLDLSLGFQLRETFSKQMSHSRRHDPVWANLNSEIAASDKWKDGVFSLLLSISQMSKVWTKSKLWQTL